MPRQPATFSGRLLLAVLAIQDASACRAPTHSAAGAPSDWSSVTDRGVTLTYQPPDGQTARRLLDFALTARDSVERFFGERIAGDYEVRVFPDRAGFNRRFESIGITPQCWMIARASRQSLELLSPRVWTAEGCGHDGSDSIAIRRIIAHETVHLHHARVSEAPEVNAVAELKWFNEGVAVFASGQFDEGARQEAATAAARGDIGSLALIGQGTAVYSVGGSLAAFIEHAYGRAALREALRAIATPELLDRLGTDESALLAAWTAWMR